MKYLDPSIAVVTVNPYEPGTVTTTPNKTRSTRWLVWSGVALLSLAALCLVATIIGMMWSFESVANSSSTPAPYSLARGISYASLPSIGIVPLGVLGIVLLIAGFLVRQPASKP